MNSYFYSSVILRKSVSDKIGIPSSLAFLFFDELEADDAEKLLMKTQNIISLKAAAWIAIVGEEIQQIERYDNLLERYKLREGYGLIEFLGNDIDTGFRVKKETENA